MKSIFDTEHDYYCSEGPHLEEYENLSSFLEEWGDADWDYNLLFRWDLEPSEEEKGKYVFSCFFVMQRKGYLFSTKTLVTKNDEEEILKFINPRAEHIKKLWSPFF